MNYPELKHLNTVNTYCKNLKNIIIYKEGSVPKTTIDIVSPVFKNTITDKDTTNYQDKSTKEETMIKSISIKISRRKLGEFIEQDLITIWTKIQ